MVGKTPQVREIVYNVLDDTGARSVVAKGATTVDVGDTQELFTRTTALESLTSNNVSNISVAQSNIIALQNFLGGAVLDAEIENVFNPLLLRLETSHVSNVIRITTLEDVQLSNSLIISNNFSNITILQDDFDSNINRIDVLEVIHVSNVANINGNFSNISILQGESTNNFSNISTLFATIESITDFGDITTLQTDVISLKERINEDIIKIGEDAGANDPGGASISIGQGAGQYIGTNSIAIGAAAQPNTSLEQASSTQGSIVINATGTPLPAPRQSTLVIRPIQTDDSNTINIMGYNETYGEIVQSTLLRGIDGNVHATSNIIVNDNAIVFETNGNGSFVGIVEINSNIEVGGASSFTGAMQMASTLHVGDTSSFGGDMTVDANVFVHGQSFIVYNGAGVKEVILRNDGTGSFLTNVDIGQALEVGGASSFTGAMQMENTLHVGGASSFGGNMTLESDILMHGESFIMYDVEAASNIFINRAGNASFAGSLIVNTIDCKDNIDIHNSFNMRDGEGNIKAKINSDGESSFFGAMQINNTLVVDNTLTIQNGIVTAGKVIIDPSVSNSDCVTIQGGLSIFNSGVVIPTLRLDRDGTGFFAAGLGTNGTLTAKNDFTIKKTTPNQADIDVATIQASSGNASFLGTMQVGSTTTLGGALSGTSAGFTGGVTGTTGAFTAGVSGTTGTFSGDIEGADFIIPSDRRFKTEITHIPNALDKIKQISGCTYKVGDKPSAGVIAQEILKVLPEVVHTREDGYYAVSYHGLIGLLIEAVKELSEKVK